MKDVFRILLVDDDENITKSLSELLTANGYTVYITNKGSEAIPTAKRTRPHLIILDVMMAHETEGFEISREVLKTPELKNIKIILLTGIAKEMNIGFTMEPDQSWLPVSSILEKPVSPDLLLSSINNLFKEPRESV